MKNFGVIFLSFALLLAFFLVLQQKNKDLIRVIDAQEKSIRAQTQKQILNANFRSKQQQIELVNLEMGALETSKDRSVDSLIRFMNGVPENISLSSIGGAGNEWFFTGHAASQAALDAFVRSHHLTLIKSSNLSFKVSVNL